jgi:hypothetical protein
MQVSDTLWMLGIPKFGRVARCQAALEQIASGRTVREQPRPLRK